MTNPRILLITEFIAPVNAVASIRWTKLAKYLNRDHGYQIDVLTNRKSYDPKALLETTYRPDQTLARELVHINEIHAFDDTLMIKTTNLVRNLAKRALDHLTNRKKRATKSKGLVETPKSSSASASKLDALYERYLQMRESSFIEEALRTDLPWEQYDVIISTYGPKWTHLLAERIKSEHPAIHWIADYRDALAYSERTTTQENLDFPKTHTALADHTFTVAPLDHMAMNLAAGQSHTFIPNGFDPEESTHQARVPTNKFRLAYTGTLYNDGDAKSDLRPLLLALDDLIEAGKLDSEDVEFVYCGPSEDMFLSQITSTQYLNWKSPGVVPREQALRLQAESSLLVMCTWNTEFARGIITSKIYEYFASRVPIICLCSGCVPHSLSHEMIASSQTGFCYEEADHENGSDQLKAYLLDQYNAWKKTGLTTYCPNQTYIDSFGHDHLAIEVDRVIRSIIHDEKTALRHRTGAIQ